MSTLNVDKVDPSSGTALELGTSGDTITVPTGAGLTVTDEVKTNKVSPATGTAFALGDSGDTFTVPSGATIVNSGTATGFGITSASFLPYANPVMINGNMKIAQRSTSVAGTTSGGYLTVDRYDFRVSSAGTWTMTQEALSADEAYEDGFSTAAKMDCTTADASLGAADYIRFHYAIEAQDCQLFKLGNSGSDTLTLAFWVKATKTGTNVATMIQSDPSRMCCQAYTVDATDTWEFKVLNFPADTAGAGINNDNGEGLEIEFNMASGTNFTSGTLETTWAAKVNANRAVGQVNHADSTSNNFHITGIQLEAGTYTSADLPPFRHESYGDNLARCQRYFWQASRGTSGQNIVINNGHYNDATTIICGITLPCVMRVASTLSYSALSDFDIEPYDVPPTAIAIDGGGGNGISNVCGTQVTDSGSRTKGDAGWIMIDTNNGWLSLDSEL
jgi:hypothetical protein